MCNGLTETFNGTMKSMLKRLCSEQPRQWHRYINPLLFAYREVPQESTGFSPFELLYGRAVRGPMTILKQLWTKEVEEPEVKNSYQYVFELREKLEDTLKLAHSELEKAQQKGKHYYDRKSKVRKFQLGEKVLVLLPTDHNKLLMQWKGPFEVSSVVGLNDYKVKVKGKEKVYHANLLKKYFEREETTVEGAVAVGAGATSMLSTVQLKLMKQGKKRLISESLVNTWPRSQSRTLKLDQILRTSNELNLRIWLTSSRICLLKHQVPPILFSIILNSPQTSQLDQDLTQYLTA